MKKVIKVDAVLTVLLLLIGSLFKTNHWPGANILLTVGGITGVLLFVMLLYSFRKKQLSGIEIASIWVASVTLMFTFLAFTFKVLHLAGAGTIVWIADIGITLSVLIILIDMLMENEPVKLRLKAIALFFVLNLLMLILLLAH